MTCTQPDSTLQIRVEVSVLGQTIIIYPTVLDFLRDNEQTLEEFEVECQLLYDYAKSQLHQVVSRDCLFGVIKHEDEQKSLLFSFTEPERLAVYKTACMSRDDLLLLGDYLDMENIPVTGFDCRQEIGDVLVPYYEMITKRYFPNVLRRTFRKASMVNEFCHKQGTLRLAEWRDCDEVLKMAKEYIASVKHGGWIKENIENTIYGHIESRQVYVFENEKKELTSMVIVARMLIHIAVVSCLFTKEKYRQNEYASTCIVKLVQWMHDVKKCNLILEVPWGNEAMEGLCEKLGMETVGESTIYEGSFRA